MYEKYAQLAGEVAREAGQFLKHFQEEHRLSIENKGCDFDFVTNADRQCQKMIAERLKPAYPGYRFVGEEDGLDDAAVSGILNSGEYCWVCDPLDGTVNYIHGLPLYAVSIGLVLNGRSLAGAIYLPETDELFTAARGHGARRNGEIVHTSECPDLHHAFISADIASSHPERRSANLARIARVAEVVTGTRVLGSACVAIARTACGQQDGYWNKGLHAWDVAAGAVILEEAGGAVSDIYSNPFKFNMENGFLGTCGTLKGAFRDIMTP